MSRCEPPVFSPHPFRLGQPATLGVMGGGQLGRMFVHAAQRLGYFTAVLDPTRKARPGLVSHHHIQTDYRDARAEAAGRVCAAITTEFENVPAPRCNAGRQRPWPPAPPRLPSRKTALRKNPTSLPAPAWPCQLRALCGD